ncbi:MAG: glycosyl transferase [Verrucomicrobiota bacterium]
MNYGYFDDALNEYVITRPDTPNPWINYLGDSGGHSGIISNTAGGTSYFQDPMHFRLLRQRLHSLPVDRPGRYIYLRDTATGEYWSPSWQPVMKALDTYECRHGLGYTSIRGTYSGIETETLYFVPPGKNYELWRCRVRNAGSAPRSLRLFSYAEFSHYKAMLDLQMSWALMCGETSCRDGVTMFRPFVEVQTDRSAFFGTTAPLDGFDCSQAAFIGAYRSESNPIAVENGACSNTGASAESSVGAHCIAVDLEPGETREIVFVLGTARNRAEAAEIIAGASKPEVIEADFLALRDKWTSYRSSFQVKTPDEDVNRTLNVWNPYQAKVTFDWSRFISYYERGLDRGIGFRDTMQDNLGVLHTVAAESKEKIKLLLRIQFQAGNCKAMIFPLTGKSEGGGRSDDQMWTIYAVAAYLRETGDYSFLDEIVPYVDGGEGTVLDHIERGIAFSQKTTGEHGIPLFLHCDWNDSLAPVNINGKVESAFVFFQLGLALKEIALIYDRIGQSAKAIKARTDYEAMRPDAEALWEGNWFARGYDSNGRLFGTSKNTYCRMFLNPQSWAVLSGLATPAQAKRAMESVRENLDTIYGLQLLCSPSPVFDPANEGYLPMPAGSRENGGIFFHSNPWAIIAETLLGRNEEAFESYRKILPCRRNEIADVTGVEPYVFCQNMLGPDHPRFGCGYNTWLSGTASWMFVAGTQYLLGIRPDFDGLIIDPCIPREWDGFEAIRVFRGATYKIKIHNRSGEAHRVSSLLVDGREVPGSKAPLPASPGQEISIEAFI